MRNRNLVPAFSDQSNKQHHVNKLRGEMFCRHINAEELIGVLVHNVNRQVEEGSFLDSPIPIDPMDQERLLAMHLIRRAGRSALAEHDEPIAELSRLGRFVVEHATFIVDDRADSSVPRVDTDILDQRLADGFAG